VIKIIFLDVDGVLNSENYYVHSEERHRLRRMRLNKKRSELTDYEIYRADIDDEAVNVLKHIIDKTGAILVISSTWRYGATWDALNEIFEELNMKQYIKGRTGRSGCADCYRGNQIMRWLKDNDHLIEMYATDYKNYVILDDDSDMLYWQKDNFVQTN